MASKIDLMKYVKAIEVSTIAGVNEGIRILSKSIQEKSPTDTGEYIRGNKQQLGEVKGDMVVGKVYNSSTNATEVEFGFRKSPVNRHKGPPRTSGTRIFTGIGARVYTRTYDEKQEEVKKILSSKVKLGLTSGQKGRK